MPDQITLNIPLEKYRFMVKTLESFKASIRKLGLHPLFKQSLMRDIYALESILKTNQPTTVKPTSDVRG